MTTSLFQGQALAGSLVRPQLTPGFAVFCNHATDSNTATCIAMDIRLRENTAVYCIRFASDDRQGIQAEQHRAQQQHEVKSFSACIHNKLPRGRTIPL